MDPAESGRALAALGEDLFVLSIRRRDGKLLTRGRIDLGLMGSELVRLAAAGRVRITEGRIEVVDQTATGDPELDAALLTLIAAPFPPRPVTWVGLPRPGIRDAYAARLVSARVLRIEAARRLGAPRYHLTGSPRVAGARSRLDAITAAAGPRPTLPRRPWAAWPARSGWAVCCTRAGTRGTGGPGWVNWPARKSSRTPPRLCASPAGRGPRPGPAMAPARRPPGQPGRRPGPGRALRTTPTSP